MTTISATTSIDLMGFDFWCLIEIEVTSWGEHFSVNSASLYPPDGPEYYISGLSLRLDDPDRLGPAWDIDPRDALFEVMELNRAISEAASDAVHEEGSARYWDRRSRRRAF